MEIAATSFVRATLTPGWARSIPAVDEGQVSRRGTLAHHLAHCVRRSFSGKDVLDP